MGVMNLDRIDRKILAELDRNARQPVSDIARKLHLGRDIVVYRLDRLFREEVISKTVVFIDPSRLGLSLYKTYLKLGADTQKTQRLIKHLLNDSRIYWLAQCYGSWDLFFSVFARSAKDFDEIQNDVFEKFHEMIHEFTVAEVVELWGFPRRYFIETNTQPFYYGGVSKAYELDELEAKILIALGQDARVSVNALAEMFNVSPHLIRGRIHRMEQEKVIIQYSPQLNLDKLGYSVFKAQIYLKSFAPKLEEKLLAFCKRNPNVIYMIRQLNECKLELEFEAESYNHFNTLLGDMYEKLGSLIQRVNHCIIHRDYHHRIPSSIIPQREGV